MGWCDRKGEYFFILFVCVIYLQRVNISCNYNQNVGRTNEKTQYIMCFGTIKGRCGGKYGGDLSHWTFERGCYKYCFVLVLAKLFKFNGEIFEID